MVTLAIEGSTGSQLTYQLAKQVISIGASSSNDIVIRAPGVAPRHLVIQRNGEVFTFLGQNRQVAVLNGERRSRGVIRVGDRIRIGTATLVFKGVEEDDSSIELVREAGGTPEKAPTSSGDAAETVARVPGRSQLVLYSEPHRIAHARARMVELFRPGVQSDLVPALRVFFAEAFPERQSLLAWLDENGEFQPVVSCWTGDLPKLPPRTFAELATAGRFGVLRLGSREIVLYPVEPTGTGPRAYLLLETAPEDEDEDRDLAAELAWMLAVHWERVESSSTLYGPWEREARVSVAEALPGTSQAVRVLRDGVLAAARSPHPVLLGGRRGSGRMFAANLIASIHPTGGLPVSVVRADESEEAAIRTALMGPGASPPPEAGIAERAKGSVVVVQEVHQMPVPLQRELAAMVAHDLESGYGPSVRWMATTEADCMALLTEGRLDPTLFHVFQRHVVRVPSLQERREDLPLLIVRLLDRIGAEQGKEIRGIELDSLNSLLNHTFDGEMTELIGELRRLVSATPPGEMVRGTVPVRPSSSHDAEAPPDGGASLLACDDLKRVIPEVERLVIDRVLRRTKGNQSKAARLLNLSRGALISKMKEYEISDYRYLRRKR